MVFLHLVLFVYAFVHSCGRLPGGGCGGGDVEGWGVWVGER